MRKEYIILGIGVVLIMAYLYFPRNFSSPNEYFQDRELAPIYLEFKKGGNLKYHSSVPNDTLSITSKNEIKDFYKMFESLDFDISAPHRGNRDYSVYINTGNYRSSKYLIKMSRIDGDYVFFFKEGLYRKDDLAQKINKLLEIGADY